MTRLETRFEPDDDIIVVTARITGPRGSVFGRLALDTGAVLVHVFDLGHDDIDGLVGLNFLNQLNYEIRSTERRILVEPVAPTTA
jgi:hypothetical protein